MTADVFLLERSVTMQEKLLVRGEVPLANGANKFFAGSLGEVDDPAGRVLIFDVGHQVRFVVENERALAKAACKARFSSNFGFWPCKLLFFGGIFYYIDVIRGFFEVVQDLELSNKNQLTQLAVKELLYMPTQRLVGAQRSWRSV